MKRRIIALLAAVCLLLTGCAPITLSVEELMRPPQLSEGQRQIHDALLRALGTTASNVSLRYPSSGDNRSAFIFHDLDGDRQQEVVVFYSFTEDPEEIYINVMEQGEEDWYSVYDMPGAGIGVDSVEFGSVSRRDGRDLIVGWTAEENSIGQLSVIRYEEEKLASLYQSRYTAYTTADLDKDGLQEIFTVTLSASDDKPFASLICCQEDTISDVSNLPLNVDMESFAGLYAGWVSGSQQGLVIDGYEGQHLISELLFIRDNMFSLPYADESDFYVDVLRREGVVYSRDVDGDGVLELPVQQSAPGKTGLYFTRYCQVDQQLELRPITTAFVNDSWGYTLYLPEEWLGEVTVSENKSGEIVFTRYDAETNQIGRELLRIRVYSEKDYQDKFDTQSYHKIGQRGNFRYYASVFAGDDLSIPLSRVKELFEII